jgi:hypothetical protein
MQEKVEEMEEAMKALTLTREKYRLEKEYIFSEFKATEQELNDAK